MDKTLNDKIDELAHEIEQVKGRVEQCLKRQEDNRTLLESIYDLIDDRLTQRQDKGGNT
jgi:cell fate (sporulation/competence/biofilm development) regulator YmcA (YheA/YmcA/DUF963 family)